MKKALYVALLMLGSPSAFAADTLGKTPVKTLTKTDVQAQPVGADGSTLLNVQSNNSAIGAGGGAQVLIGLVNSTLPTYTVADIAMPSIDTAGRTYVTTDSAANLRTNITQLAGSAPSATNPFPSQLTDGTTAYVAAKTGQFPAALGQTTMAGSVSVVLASNQSTIATTTGAPTGLSSNRAAAVNIASGATTTVTCKSALTISVPVRLYIAHITTSSPMRCTLQYDNNTALTTWADVMTSPASPYATMSTPFGYSITAGASGTQAIEASCTNLDSIANDVVCDVVYCSSASGC